MALRRTESPRALSSAPGAVNGTGHVSILSMLLGKLSSRFTVYVRMITCVHIAVLRFMSES